MTCSSPAQIVREYGPFPGVDAVHGLTYDGAKVWFASGDQINALDLDSGETVATLPVPAHAGTAFDGTHIFQIAEARILKVDPATGAVVAEIPAPNGGCSGMAWAEGSLWVGEYRARVIHQVNPETGEVLRAIPCERFVTGVTWLDGELWHGVWEDEASGLHRVDPQTGAVITRLDLPEGVMVSGMESNGRDTFFCGGGQSGKVRAVRRPT